MEVSARVTGTPDPRDNWHLTAPWDATQDHWESWTTNASSAADSSPAAVRLALIPAGAPCSAPTWPSTLSIAGLAAITLASPIAVQQRGVATAAAQRRRRRD